MLRSGSQEGARLLDRQPTVCAAAHLFGPSFLQVGEGEWRLGISKVSQDPGITLSHNNTHVLLLG